MAEIHDTVSFLKGKSNRPLMVIAGGLALLYFLVVTFFFQKGTIWLYVALIVSEVFHLWQSLSYTWTTWRMDDPLPAPLDFHPDVDIFITVAGEPVEIVEQTAVAARDLVYRGIHQVYLLNDSRVAKKENWQEYEVLAKRLGIGCITRTIPGGAKAGNINNGMRETSAPLVVVFDADHVPHPDFLSKTAGYFADEKMAFVQTPQYYHNYAQNDVTLAAWEQQELFFGAILRGKNRLNATFMCGTNMVLRRQAILDAGGMCEFNIAEDFLTSLFVHERGWKSLYVPEVLAEGLAPEDFLSYYKQQFRWARGSLEVIFRFNPLFRRGLTWSQRLQYLASASYYLSGIIVLLNAMLPIVFFYFGLVPFQISTMTLAAVFLPYIFINLYSLQLTSGFSYTFRALSFSVASFWLQIRAVIAVLTREKTVFAVTSKTQITGNFAYLTIPHYLYLAVLLVGLAIAAWREGPSAAVITNLAWALLNGVIFAQFIAVALPKRKSEHA